MRPSAKLPLSGLLGSHLNDSLQLGDDPDYSNIETAFGAGLVGDMASVASARQIDRACSAGD
jgi:hypothetical protein